MLRFFLLVSLLLITLNSASGDATSSSGDVAIQHVQNLMEWMQSEGGYINPKVEIRRWNSSDPTSYFGVFTNAPIQNDELLLKIPAELTIHLAEDTQDWDYEEVVCELAWTFKEEFEEGDESDYAPYINYLKSQPKGQIPAMWSRAGQHLLLLVQGDLNTNGIETYANGNEMTMWLSKWFEKDCMLQEDEEGSLNPYFLALATQRGYDRAMMPIYDMINHQNGNKINTITRPSIFHSNGFGVYAIGDLKAGEELFYSYHGCPDCGNSLSYWGTPEMLRDFGFVESYPHRFHLKGNFTIFINQDEDTPGKFKASCRDNRCPGKQFAQHQIERLDEVYKHEVVPSKDFIPSLEYYMITEYHSALTVAFTTVLDVCPEGEDTVSVTPDDDFKVKGKEDSEVGDDGGGAEDGDDGDGNDEL